MKLFSSLSPAIAFLALSLALTASAQKTHDSSPPATSINLSDLPEILAQQKAAIEKLQSEVSLLREQTAPLRRERDEKKSPTP